VDEDKLVTFYFELRRESKVITLKRHFVGDACLIIDFQFRFIPLASESKEILKSILHECKPDSNIEEFENSLITNGKG